jgi:hypothetical protein
MSHSNMSICLLLLSKNAMEMKDIVDSVQHKKIPLLCVKFGKVRQTINLNLWAKTPNKTNKNEVSH